MSDLLLTARGAASNLPGLLRGNGATVQLRVVTPLCEVAAPGRSLDPHLLFADLALQLSELIRSA